MKIQPVPSAAPVQKELPKRKGRQEKKEKPKKEKRKREKPAKDQKEKPEKPVKGKREKKEKQEKGPKKRVVAARTNKKPNMVELELMKPHNFLTRTEAALTRIYPITPVGNHRYEVAEKEGAVSVILKLILKTDQTNPMTMDWSTILWDITQKQDQLPEGVLVTFTRHFERVDNKLAEKAIKRRTNLAIVSSGNKKNQKTQGVFVRHDAGLLNAIESGDSVVAFGAEAILTAPDEKTLEEGLNVVQNYLKSNDETRGLAWELDINRQLHPFVLYGPNVTAKNKDVFYNMTSSDAAISSLFVDSGGDRTIGSEYIGISVGKMISSHAAYLLKNSRTLLVGNDTVNATHTLLGNKMPKDMQALPSQIYWSHAISRAYLLTGHSVTHFVLDHVESNDSLMKIALFEKNKLALDVAKGYLNILEVVGSKDFHDHPERITGRFTTHLNNIIALLSQYRDVEKISTVDDFASITRSILTDFFVANKYYAYNPLEHLSDIRLVGRHDQYKTLADLGGWIAQRRKSNRDKHLENALAELNNIINENILPTIPALNKKTDPVIDELIEKKYRVLDLTGMNVGAISTSGDSTTNVMMISYLNLILPSLKNGDVIFIHGFSHISKIADIVQDMIAGCGRRVDVVFTESSQNRVKKTLPLLVDNIDLTVVDLYKNNVDKIRDDLSIDKSYAESLFHRPGTFYMKTQVSSDYVYLDHIL